jgi:hypothetical protein
MFTMVSNVFQTYLISVSFVCFKCFICFQKYVAIIISGYFNFRSSVASPFSTFLLSHLDASAGRRR